MSTPSDGFHPFQVKDCALITRMSGISSAVNLRELKERVRDCPIESLFHHFCETLIRPSFDDPEFRNDFAVWASRDLRDRVLAERLGVLNPYAFDNLEELRLRVMDIIDERLSEVPMVPWVHQGDDFRFMRAVTVVFPTHDTLATTQELIDFLPRMANSAIYYHFIESRRRRARHADDFSAWLATLADPPGRLISAFSKVDFYYLNLEELRSTLLDVARKALSNG